MGHPMSRALTRGTGTVSSIIRKDSYEHKHICY
jgi:hypothetical protein